MATPTRVKNWDHAVNVNISEASVLERNRACFLALKQALTGALSYVDDANVSTSLTVPCTVQASSNGSSAGAADYWSGKSDLIWAAAGVAHSWIHLRFPNGSGAGVPLDMLIDLIPADANGGRFYLSYCKAGYNSDGTTTNRPTAAGTEVVIKDGVSATGTPDVSDATWGSDSAGTAGKFHFSMTDDGQIARWCYMTSGNPCVVAGNSADQNGSGRTEPWYAWWLSIDGNGDINTWTATTSWRLYNLTYYVDEGSIVRRAWITQSVFNNANGLQVLGPDPVDNARPGSPIYVVDDVTNMNLGTLEDTWWGRAGDNSGDGAPTATPTFALVGEQWWTFPQGVTMLTT